MTTEQSEAQKGYFATLQPSERWSYRNWAVSGTRHFDLPIDPDSIAHQNVEQCLREYMVPPYEPTLFRRHHNDRTPTVPHYRVVIRRDGGKPQVVWATGEIWNRTHFRVTLRSDEPQIYGFVHLMYPIDADQSEIDIQDANDWHPNESNNGWIFEHASALDHHGIDDLIQSMVQQVFQPHIQRAAHIVLAPSDTTVAEIKTAIIKGNASDLYGMLLDLQDDVLEEARDIHHGHPLGHYAQQGLHYSEVASSAWEAVVKSWRADSEKLQRLTSHSVEVGKVGKGFEVHSYRRRWEDAS